MLRGAVTATNKTTTRSPPGACAAARTSSTTAIVVAAAPSHTSTANGTTTTTAALVATVRPTPHTRPCTPVTWREMLALLVHYTAREGHCRVPFLHKEESLNLGTWVGTQRTANKNGFLSQEKIQRLESIAMVWTAIDPRWEEMFALLVQYKAREGHCNVPGLHQEESITLGTWVGTQRDAKR